MQLQFDEMDRVKLSHIAQKVENGEYCELHAIWIDIHIGNMAERHNAFARDKNLRNYIELGRQMSLLIGFDEACQMCEKCRMMRTH